VNGHVSRQAIELRNVSGGKRTNQKTNLDAVINDFAVKKARKRTF
jgi:hypothetical protein